MAAVPGSESSAQLGSMKAAVDSVYFLMFDGWQTELQSNRWHYSRRWARHLPVTLLQPSQHTPGRTEAYTSRTVPNCEILPIADSVAEDESVVRAVVQTAQVTQHMRERRHMRPLLWCYNPRLAGLYAAVPAAARVFHATENYFDFGGMVGFFRRELEASLCMSDLIVAVSSGVERGIRVQLPEAQVALITNGCDTRSYTSEGPDHPRIAAAREGYARVAVFAGNVNSRLDFDLVERAATENPTTLVVVAGPVTRLNDTETTTWERILRLRNVHYLGVVQPSELPSLYRGADLGFIPYRSAPWLVRNGFPLKTLEMAATGLPVVASHMESIAGLASAIVVAENDARFLRAFASLARTTVRPDEAAELLHVSSVNDYDKKFQEVIDHLCAVLPPDKSAHTRLDELLEHLGHEPWTAACAHVLERAPEVSSEPPRRPLPRRLAASAYCLVGNALPPSLRQRIPPRLRDRLRNWVTA